jgi:hypothetical protein
MSNIRKAVSVIVAAALASTSVTPAFAGNGGGFSSGYGWGGGYGKGYRHRHYRHRDRVDAGDVIGAVAVIGIIAAIASSASKNKRKSGGLGGSARGNIVSEEAAVDACAQAAESQAGSRASVRDISQVDRTSDGWDVEGVIEQREDWRDDRPEERRFTCSVRFGSVDSVYIDTDTLALR